jgi:hypothetical protein
VTIETATGTITKDRTTAAFPDREIDRAGRSRGERNRDGLAALAMNHEGAVTPLETELLYVSTDCFRHAEPVQREQRDQSVIAGTGQAGGDEHRADLVSVQTGRVGLVIQARAADMNGWRPVEESFFDRVPVQTCECAQPSLDRCLRPPEVFEVAGEAFDVATGDGEQSDAAVVAPLRELAEIERVGVACETGVAAQEPGKGSEFGIGEHVVVEHAQRCGMGH